MSGRLVRVLFLFLALVGAAGRGGAEDVLRPDIRRDVDIPSPEDFLGYPLGSEFTPHHRIAAYFETLAASSDRVSVSSYGTSVEGRPLLLVTVSDPAHLGETAALQRDYAKLADPVGLTTGECETLARELPVAVWLSFGVHGNEASPSEAAMAVAYELASADDQAARRLLQEAVVLLDPCLNPDGRDRYVHWFRSVRGSRPDPDPRAREHHEPWPGGRTNHYFFDLNRDWAWLTQPESRARVREYLAWHPQVHVDFHEMEPDGSYFFFPPAKPIHPAFPPEVSKWAEIFGKGNAAAFDARGWAYYTGERFDLYYPGYGDTWPTFQGAVGMTYEQGGHGTAGLALALAEGDTLTLTERIAHHTGAALSTVEIAAAHREERLRDFSRFFAADGRKGPAAYLFPPGPDPARTQGLIGLLLDHGVRVTRAEGELRPDRLRSYRGGEPPRELPAGTFVVSSEQPQWRFVQAVLEPETVAPDTFFYDLSAWSLPLAYGVDAYWTEQPVRGEFEPVMSLSSFEGRGVDPGSHYAFLIPWTRNGAPRVAARLQEAGVEISFTTRAIVANGVRFPPGSLIVFGKGNPPDLDRLLDQAAREAGVDVMGVDSGLTGDGPDLGSPRVVKLMRPRVAILADEPVDPSSAGAAWFLLDQRYPLRHSLLTLEALTEEDLRDFDVLVFPDDAWGGRGYELAVDSARVAAVTAWIEGGGVFVGLGGGAFFASADKAGFSTVKEASWDEAGPDATEEERRAREREERLETQTEEEIRRREELLPGTIFRVRVDPGKPLGFGYDEELMVLLVHNRALELGPPGTNVAWFEESSRVSGYATPKVEDRLTEKPFLVDEPRGAGHVVLFVSDPNFRLFWPGLTRLFLNALYFVPSLAAN